MESGLTKPEEVVMDHLIDAYNEFIKITGQQHTSERIDFMNAIHQAQSVLALRILRRNYPDYWV